MKTIRSSFGEWFPFLALAIMVSTLPSAFADGCFVGPKFVWDKHKDINEPTQKAVIVYDAGREAGTSAEFAGGQAGLDEVFL
jgi:hypothetical protein